MPTYGYKCPKCGHEFDVFQKMSDTNRPKCPKCGTRRGTLISGGAGVVFKGSGFYETDYKRAGASTKPADESTKSDSAKTEPKAEPKTETKPPRSLPPRSRRNDCRSRPAPRSAPHGSHVTLARPDAEITLERPRDAGPR